MAAIRLFRQGMIRVVMAGRIGRLNMLSSLIGNLAFCDGEAPLFSTWIEDRSLNKHSFGRVCCHYTAGIWFTVMS